MKYHKHDHYYHRSPRYTGEPGISGKTKAVVALVGVIIMCCGGPVGVIIGLSILFGVAHM